MVSGVLVARRVTLPSHVDHVARTERASQGGERRPPYPSQSITHSPRGQHAETRGQHNHTFDFHVAVYSGRSVCCSSGILREHGS